MNDDFNEAELNQAISLLKKDEKLLKYYPCDAKYKKDEKCVFCVTDYSFYLIRRAKKMSLLAEGFLTDLCKILATESEGYGLCLESRSSDTIKIKTPDVDDIINVLRRRVLGELFVGLEKENNLLSIHVPEDRLKPLNVMARPCGNFAVIYAYECRVVGQSYCPEIPSRLEQMATQGESSLIDLNDIHPFCELMHMPVVIRTLCYNTYFTKITFSLSKIDRDIALMILYMLRRNSKLEALDFSNTLPGVKDFWCDMFKELMANPYSKIRRVKLDQNRDFGDSGAQALAVWLSSSTVTLERLSLSNCNIKSRGLTSLVSALRKNEQIATKMTHLDLSYNRVDATFSRILGPYLTQPSTINKLKLADMGLALEDVFGALNCGACRSIRHLDVSYNKLNTHCTAPMCLFVQGTTMLEEMRLDGLGMSQECVLQLLNVFNQNPFLRHVALSISKNGLTSIPNVSLNSFERLNLSDNPLEDGGMQALVETLSNAFDAKYLDISRTISKKSTKSREVTLELLGKFLASPDLTLRSLVFQGGKNFQLGTSMVTFFDRLTDSIIKELDVSGHDIGNRGAAALGQMLRYNQHLTRLSWDENSVTCSGFMHFYSGLRHNNSLTCMVMPVKDVEACLNIRDSNREVLFKVLEDIQQHTFASQTTSLIPKQRRPHATSTRQMVIDNALFTLNSYADAHPSMLQEGDKIAIKNAVSYSTITEYIQASRSSALEDVRGELRRITGVMVPDISRAVAGQVEAFEESITKKVRDLFVTDEDRKEESSKHIEMMLKFGINEAHLDAIGALDLNALFLNVIEQTLTLIADAVSNYCYEKVMDHLTDSIDRIRRAKQVEQNRIQEEAAIAREGADAITAGAVGKRGSSSNLKKEKDRDKKKEKKPKDHLRSELSSSKISIVPAAFEDVTRSLETVKPVSDPRISRAAMAPTRRPPTRRPNV